MKIENVTTTRLSNPFDNYRLQSAQNIYSGNKSELKEFVSAIGATKCSKVKLMDTDLNASKIFSI